MASGVQTTASPAVRPTGGQTLEALGLHTVPRKGQARTPGVSALSNWLGYQDSNLD
jgi:hypothetical protein